jgi:hypothetical protein
MSKATGIIEGLNNVKPIDEAMKSDVIIIDGDPDWNYISTVLRGFGFKGTITEVDGEGSWDALVVTNGKVNQKQAQKIYDDSVEDFS